LARVNEHAVASIVDAAMSLKSGELLTLGEARRVCLRVRLIKTVLLIGDTPDPRAIELCARKLVVVSSKALNWATMCALVHLPFISSEAVKNRTSVSGNLVLPCGVFSS